MHKLSVDKQCFSFQLEYWTVIKQLKVSCMIDCTLIPRPLPPEGRGLGTRLDRLLLFKRCFYSIYWLAIIVLSISVASVVSESEVGLNAHTIAPSLTPDCWSPSCLTWSQCLADTSRCLTSHTTITILQGEYILHEYVDVFDVVSLAIYGTRSEVNNSAKENQVVINCEQWEKLHAH